MKIINRFIRLAVLITFIFIFSGKPSEYVSSIENTSMNKTVNLSAMAMAIKENEHEKLNTSLNTISGELTSYIYNCPACTGRLACLSTLDLSNGTTTFNDSEYGEVYIVASSKNLPCGSIVSFDTSLSDKTMYAVVLDRGVVGNDLDLLVDGLEYAYQVGRKNITYNVLRSGW